MLTDADVRKLQKLFTPLATKKDVADIRDRLSVVNKDVQKLKETVATKTDLLDVTADLTVLRSDVRELRADMKALRETVQEIAVSVDKFVKIASDLREEHAAISVQLTRHERWFKEIAKKTGISFEI